ncbi:unnamed protein product [Effrenium voratum]|nr:unnamed protein product [Effrenium voratum]
MTDNEQRWQKRFEDAKRQEDAGHARMELQCRYLEAELDRTKEVHASELRHFQEQKRLLTQGQQTELEDARREERRKVQMELDKVKGDHHLELEELKRRHERSVAILKQQADAEAESLRRAHSENTHLTKLVEQVQGSVAEVERLSKRVDTDKTLEWSVRERQLEARERSAKELEAQLQRQTKEVEEQRRRLSELVQNLQSRQEDDTEALASERQRLQAEHQRLLELQQSVREADRNNKEALKHTWAQAEEDRRSLQQEQLRFDGEQTARKEELDMQERQLRSETERLKALHQQIEVSRQNAARRIRETETTVANDGAYVAEPLGTLLADGSRWGAFEPEKVSFWGEVDRFLAKTSVEVVASGFRWTEGPTWVASDSSLLFSDTIDARIYRWTRDGVAVVLEHSGGFDGSNVPGHEMLFEVGSNGMALHEEHLYVCQHPTHRVVRIALADLTPGRFCEKKFQVLADSFEGRRLNSPNDVVLGPDGAVWFTDPIYGLLKKPAADAFGPVLPAAPDPCHNPCDLPYLDESSQQKRTGVFRWKDGDLQLATTLLDRPNGLAFSPEGDLLWVANSNKHLASWTAFEVGTPLRPVRALSETGASPAGIPAATLGEMPGRGVSDGFKIDAEGFIWSSMPQGVCIIDPRLPTPRVVAKVFFNTNISNIAFGEGGDVWVTGLGHIWRLQRR